ncbi:NADH-quinone oxidoreductase subunit H [Nakamurella flavida]|uniref:NADH-quinone oxidoreductase subunit H n=1 Tax=Nakamurella flavida TaxID=363630 RepID=A0A939BYX4_9ACTN|nr:NADH-quinone oxidoreductase subunit H [Nakamurella flavida]MBM9475138.1 NADH-quinone oxidoreductase subunit H [Nakamurella flavida]MDP9776708.1 NADH-quinone oxidoreductase subunit H [Nakamurella flavida]
MPDTAGDDGLGPIWVLPLVVVAILLALAAAGLDGALRARSSGRSALSGSASPLAEVARLLVQRRRRTLNRDPVLHQVGILGLPLVALLMLTVVPIGDRPVLDLPVGVVWFNALDVVVWAVVWLAGWAPNSDFALIGGYRFLALAMAYELPLMFALTAPAVAAGSLRLTGVVAAQGGWWFAVWMPVAFAVYLLGVAGFAVWGPLSAPMGADLAGGVLVETSGPDRLLLLGGRYLLLVAGAAFAVPMFLGGGGGPLLPAWLWVVVKTAAVLAALVLLRRRLPTLRPDRFLEVGWVVLLPAALVQLLVVAIVVGTSGGDS